MVVCCSLSFSHTRHVDTNHICPDLESRRPTNNCTIGELSSKCDEFLAVRSQFDSDNGVNFSGPTYCQSTTFVRPLFAF